MANEIYNHSHWGFPRYTDWGGEYYADTGNIITDGDFTTQTAVDFWQIEGTSGTPRATKTLESGFMRLTYDLANGSALYKGSSFVPINRRYKVQFFAKGTVSTQFLVQLVTMQVLVMKLQTQQSQPIGNLY